MEERQRAEAEERTQRANEKAFHDLMPAVQRWAAGEGEVSEIKRFGRRPELRLLTLMPSEMKHKVSSFQWTQYMTSGLQRIEVRAIAHKLRDRDVPASADPFRAILKERILGYGEPSAAELGTMPAFASSSSPSRASSSPDRACGGCTPASDRRRLHGRRTA